MEDARRSVMIRLPVGAGLALVALVACGELPLENQGENGPGEPTAQAALTPSLPGCFSQLDRGR
jgi:hypothetical protein